MTETRIESGLRWFFVILGLFIALTAMMAFANADKIKPIFNTRDGSLVGAFDDDKAVINITNLEATANGTGTLNYLTKWVNVSEIGDSSIVDDGNEINVTQKIQFLDSLYVTSNFIWCAIYDNPINCFTWNVAGVDTLKLQRATAGFFQLGDSTNTIGLLVSGITNVSGDTYLGVDYTHDTNRQVVHLMPSLYNPPGPANNKPIGSLLAWWYDNTGPKYYMNLNGNDILSTLTSLPVNNQWSANSVPWYINLSDGSACFGGMNLCIPAYPNPIELTTLTLLSSPANPTLYWSKGGQANFYAESSIRTGSDEGNSTLCLGKAISTVGVMSRDECYISIDNDGGIAFGFENQSMEMLGYRELYAFNETVMTTTNFSVSGSEGITDSSSYWLCTANDCSTSCQVDIKGGIIIGCT